MKVAVYARYSSDQQREESIEAQLRAIGEYCRIKGYEPIGNYIDMAMSGTNDNRPEFLRMIEDSKSRTFEGVVVHKLDRFARNRYDSAIYGRKLQVNGVKIISVLENLDDSPESVILRSVIEGYNEYYSLNLARETMKGLKENAYKAKHNGGTPPLGYDVAPDKTYVINEKEAEAVRLIFRMYLDGEGYMAIADALNYLGYKTKKGRTFNRLCFWDLLENEKYTGVYVYNKREGTDDGKKQNRNHKEEADIIRVEDGMPPIISKRDFERVKVKRQANKHKTGSYSAVEEYALSGIIRCGKCGGAMVGSRHHAGRGMKHLYVDYVCSTRRSNKTCDAKPVKRDYIEDVVYKYLVDDFLQYRESPDFLRRIQRIMDTGRGEHMATLKILKRQQQDVDNQVTNMVNAIAAGVDPGLLAAKSKQLSKEKDELTRSIHELEFRIVEAQIKVEDIAKTLREADLSAMGKTELFRRLISKVSVTDEAIDMEYRIATL